MKFWKISSKNLNYVLEGWRANPLRSTEWGTIDGTKYATKGNSGYHDVPIKHSAYNRKVCLYSTRVFQNVV